MRRNLSNWPRSKGLPKYRLLWKGSKFENLHSNRLHSNTDIHRTMLLALQEQIRGMILEGKEMPKCNLSGHCSGQSLTCKVPLLRGPDRACYCL